MFTALMDCRTSMKHLRIGVQRLARITALAGIASMALALPARALTFNWSFINDDGNPIANDEITSGTITGLVQGVNDLQQPGITAVLTSSTNLPTPISFFSAGGSFGTLTVSGSTLTYDGFSLQSADGRAFFFAFESAGGVADFDNGSDINEGGIVTFTLADPGPTPVPGPLPLLGAGVAFRFSRRLRKRVAGQR